MAPTCAATCSKWRWMPARSPSVAHKDLGPAQVPVCSRQQINERAMMHFSVRYLVTLLGLSGLLCGRLAAEEPAKVAPAQIPAQAAPIPSKSIHPSIPQPSTARAPQMIVHGRSTMATGRARIGITHGLGSYAFKTTPMARRIAGSVGPTQMMGNAGVEAGRERPGVTRSGKTNHFGVSPFVRAPHMNGPSGLSTLHTPGRAWSSFRPNGSVR